MRPSTSWPRLCPNPAGALSDRLGRRNILLASFVIFLVTYAGFALTRQLPIIAVLFALYGLYQGIFRAAGKALASDFAAEQLRGSAVGWYNTTVGLAGLIASLVAGFLMGPCRPRGHLPLRRRVRCSRRCSLACPSPGDPPGPKPRTKI